MRKRLKKILKFTLYTVTIILLVIVVSVIYLIMSADMKQPDIVGSIPENDLIIEGNYRQWGDNYLRQSETGLWELKVSGADFERGVARGKLSEDLLYYQEKVFVDQIRVIVPSDNYLRFLGAFTLLFNRNLGENVIEEYRREIYGISLSCTSEYNYISTPYERQLNYHAAHDLGHAMQDYMLVGCSSFASWGKNTADSSLIIGRNFDFYVGDEFATNKEISFYAPEKGYKYASVSWPGMTGVLSGMNEEGLTVTINAAKSAMPTSAATPISLLVREILQYASTIDEAYAIAQKRKTFVAESILIGSAKDKRAAIIEKSPHQISFYTGKAEDDQIISTNHYQSDLYATDEQNIENIKTSDSKYRFDRMTELLKENRPIDVKKSASILRNRKGLDNEELGLTNEMAINQFIAHHSVIFKPEEKLIWVSTSPWQLGKYVAYDLNKIFNDSIDFRNEIYSKEYMIDEDPILHTSTYSDLITFKRLTKKLKQASKAKDVIATDTLDLYLMSNPNYYYTYDVLGDYYHQVLNNNPLANSCWGASLSKKLPKQAEKNRIEKKMNIN